jgi:hypothetical protein
MIKRKNGVFVMKKKIILTTILGLFLAFAIVVLIVNVREYFGFKDIRQFSIIIYSHYI